MTTIRETILRDIGVKVEGVVKVFDRGALADEIREYVVTDKIESELKSIFETFTHVSEIVRRGGSARDVMGVWVSGFFGSGKSHFAKVLGHLLQNTALTSDGNDHAIDSFTKHLSDTPRGQELRRRLGEVKLSTHIHTIAFEIRSRQSLLNPNSVGEIILSEFYRYLGLAQNVVVADVERRLQKRRGGELLSRMESEYKSMFGTDWRSEEGREDLSTVRRRLAQVLPVVDPANYPDERIAKESLADAFRHHVITAEGIAEELVTWVDEQPSHEGRATHLIFVIDEMGTFIGDSTDKIGELNSIAEMIGNKGKGKVWLIVTGQQDLERVVDRTNFQPALVGRLNARFELKPHLISDEINKVVAERLLRKHPSKEDAIRKLFHLNDGALAQLADLKATRNLGSLTEETFVQTYPFLPHQVRLAQDIFEALSGFRISGGVRSMISVVMDALNEIADEPVGILVSFDRIFDAVENDLLSQEYLGAAGVRSIREADERLNTALLSPSRVLKVLWLLGRITWVPRIPETIAKLLARDFVTPIAELRQETEATLLALRDGGYAGKDEATGEWKFLNEQERTIEQAIADMVRSGGQRSISLGKIRQTSQAVCRDHVLSRKKFSNFAVLYGNTKTVFPFGVTMDGESIESGPEIEVHFFTPLAPGKSQALEEARRLNQAAGAKGRTVWLIADSSESLEARLRRYEALASVTSDKRFTDDTSPDTQTAMSEKRKERDLLATDLSKEIDRAFLSGTLIFGGQEQTLEGRGDLRDVIDHAIKTVIPNVFPRFPVADKPFDFVKQLKALLNPASVALAKVAPDLELFDSQGMLQKESPLVAAVLEAIHDLNDDGHDTSGALLLDSKQKGFPGFSRAPYHWPDELVRLVLAASFRAGAIFLEQQTSRGSSQTFDYRGTDDVFAKINTFKKVVFKPAETSLSVDQIKEASKGLAALGVKGIPESGNALAAAVRSLATGLKSDLDTVSVRAQQGLPVPDSLAKADETLAGAVIANDPTVVVTAFIERQKAWKKLKDGLESIRSFIDQGRLATFQSSRRFDDAIAMHPTTTMPAADKVQAARDDMRAILSAREIVGRWKEYQEAFDRAFQAYRDVYRSQYDEVRLRVEQTIEGLKNSASYSAADPRLRDKIVDTSFALGSAFYFPPADVTSVEGLLQALSMHPLSSLRQAELALEPYGVSVEGRLEPAPHTPTGSREKRPREWNSSRLRGRRFTNESEVDDELRQIGDEIKTIIREGNVVVVK
jgi:hypothetical protein